MLNFPSWSTEKSEELDEHQLRLISVADSSLSSARDNVLQTITDHYVSPERIANTLENLGKLGVAKLLRTKMPRTIKTRSGELGEIMATEYVEECTDFRVPIKRLRWKDSREMPMRGEDAIGICYSRRKSRVDFLKVEAKSRKTLRTCTIKFARKALNKNSGLPSSHALSFLVDRLREINLHHLADRIESTNLQESISISQMTHMIFVFSGNSPERCLRSDLTSNDSKIKQISVGLRIEQHQEFINKVYDGVLNCNVP